MSNTSSIKNNKKNKGPIKGPILCTLHADGVDYFIQRNQQVKKIQLFDGTEGYGLYLPTSDAASLQRMAVIGYINRIDHEVKALAQERANIIDLTKLLSYGMLYRQFDTRVWNIMMSSDLATQWNRQYPKVSIGFGTKSRSAGILKLISANEAAIAQFKQGLLKSVQSSIMSNPKALPEEQRKQMFLAIRFINMVDPLVWMLLSVYRSTPQATQLLQEVQQVLINYLGKTDAPEYLAFMLIELIIIVGGFEALGDGVVSETSMGSVFLSYDISPLKRDQGERTRLRISLANKQQNEFESLRSKVDEKSQLKNSQKSLDNFFQAGEGALLNNKEIGLYYLSYLKEACKSMNISFESFVNVIPNTRQTLMNLILTF